MPLITEAEINLRVEKYIEEIADLRTALKYATATYHGSLLKICNEEGHCPICGTNTLSNRKDTVFRQKSGCLTGESSHETPSQ